MSKVISVFEFISFLSNRFVIPYHDKPLEPLHVQKNTHHSIVLVSAYDS